MKPAIHYAFKAKLIRRIKENGEFDFIDVFQEFFDDEPIKAREKAFIFYQNYIDVLLDSKGLSYTSDKQAREVMESFWDPKTSHLELFGEKQLKFPDAFGNGIGVFLIIDEVIDEPEFNENMVMIHGIGLLYEGFLSTNPDGLARGLAREYQYFQYFHYDLKGYMQSIAVFDPSDWLEGDTSEQPKIFNILKTPFDWSGYDQESWLDDLEDVKEDLEQSKIFASIEDVIDFGETNTVEFKPSLLYNFKTNTAGIGVKGIIAKSICGFLNSKGGILFIGVNDNGNIQGLSYDYCLAGEKNKRDFFRLEFDDLLKQFLPSFIMGNIKGEFVEINGVEIFLVTVYPSKSKPIFMNGKDGKEFWVRWTASTRQYKDVEEIVNYCLEHWGKDDIED